jgi:flavin reductase (DIM6/NTAB) family NADH-FMN oxidoreductase RutF
MHYATENPQEHRKHGLKFNPFKAIIAPRPIGWIATVSEAGIVNLAPYSFFNAVSDVPPMVMFSSASRKDSLRNIERNGEFTCSIASHSLVDQMNLSSAPVVSEVSEFQLTQLLTAPSLVVKPPRVAASPAAIECRLWKTLELPGPAGDSANVVVFGHVVAVYINDEFVKDGILDTAAMRPLARMGYMDYGVITPETSFTLNRPLVDASGRSASVLPGPWDGVYR